MEESEREKVDSLPVVLCMCVFLQSLGQSALVFPCLAVASSSWVVTRLAISGSFARVLHQRP